MKKAIEASSIGKQKLSSQSNIQYGLSKLLAAIPSACVKWALAAFGRFIGLKVS